MVTEQKLFISLCPFVKHAVTFPFHQEVVFLTFLTVSATYITYTRAEGMQAVLLTSSRCVVSVDNLFTFGERSCHPSLHTVNGRNAAEQTQQNTRPAYTESNDVSVSSRQCSAEHWLATLVVS